MAEEFVLDPLNGVDSLRLGATRETVIATLGKPTVSFHKTPDTRHATDAWFNGGLQVFYEGEEPTVAFIELSNDRNLKVVLFGLPIFTTPVGMLISEVGRHAKYDEDDPELGFSYIFPSLELAFWRPDDDDNEMPYFATVGIGGAGYFSP
jgi:hypothetical protein